MFKRSWKAAAKQHFQGFLRHEWLKKNSLALAREFF